MNRFFLSVLALFVLAVGCNETQSGLKEKPLEPVTQHLVVQPDNDGSVDLGVDYDLTLDQAIDEGSFEWKSDGITTSNLQSEPHEKGKVTLKVKLFRFDRENIGRMSSEDMIKQVEEQGFRPATLRELLALAAKFPDEQRKYPIVALGSPLQQFDKQYVPCLVADGDERRLHLPWWGSAWNDGYRFLAVRKS